MADGLLNKASIILTPTGYKAGTLYNVAPVDEPYEDFDFARTSTATRINSSGLVSNVATGVPRINYDSNGENGHILLEPTSTNLNRYSNSLNPINGGSVSLNNAISPDGTLNATKLIFGTDTNDGATFNVGGSSCVSSTVYTFSFYAKSIVGDGRFNLRIDTNSQALLVDENFTATSEWVRYTHTFTSDSSATSFGSNSRYRKLTSNNEILFYGMQLEQLGYATSLIPTLTGSTETRATETANGAGSAELINSTEGVLYAEIAALVNSGLVRYLGLSDGSNNNRVVILNDGTANRIRAIVSSGGTKYADLFYNVTDVTDFHKVAVKYKANDFALWIDGVERATDTSGSAPIGLNDLEFDLNTGGAFYGKCKALAVFNEALSDDELNNLTG